MINEEDLLHAGWPAGETIRELLVHAQELEQSKGISDPKYLLKLLRRDFPPPAKPTLRDEPAPLAEAITAATPEEAKNLGAVRRQMSELLRVPVISRGALMPDACPAGSAPATIPVGGAIAVENAIIPSAHSSDICCSMYATFYRSEMETSAQLDALVASTRFGSGGRAADSLVAHAVLDEEVWENPFLKGLENKAAIHMADQGDGNHFAYLGTIKIGAEQAQKSPLPEGFYSVLVTHHGSRGLGASLFTRGQKAAVKYTAKVAQGIPESARGLMQGRSWGGTTGRRCDTWGAGRGRITNQSTLAFLRRSIVRQIFLSATSIISSGNVALLIFTGKVRRLLGMIAKAPLSSESSRSIWRNQF